MLLVLCMAASLFPALAADDADDFVSVKTWNELGAAVKKGGKVRLDADVLCTRYSYTFTVSKGVSTTLDLNGHTIDRSGLPESEVDSGTAGLFTVSEASTFTLMDSRGGGRIIGCHSGNEPSVFKVYGNSTLNLLGGTIEDCTSMNWGAILVEDSKMLMSGGVIQNSKTGDFGGAICLNSSSLLMTGGVIQNNESQGRAGAIFVNNSEFTMQGGSIRNNTVTYSGGALYLTQSTMTMSGGEIAENHSSGGTGGAIDSNYASQLHISGGTISGNTSYGDGGGIWSSSDCSIVMSGGTISGCKSDYSSGGAMYVKGKLDITGGTIENCNAGNGGAIYIAGNGSASIAGATIRGNSARYGGAIRSYGGQLRIGANTEITGNTASITAAGLYLDSKTTTKINTEAVIESNTNSKTGKADDIVNEGTLSYAEYDTYLLETVTGNSPGDRVEYFAVRYLDDKDVLRVHYIFPMDDLKTSYAAALKIGGNAQKNLDTLADKYDMNLIDSTYSCNQPKALQSYHRDNFLFTPEYAVKEIVSVELLGCNTPLDMTRSFAADNEWACQGLRVYGVDSIYGLNCVGGYSTHYYIDFEGALLAEMKAQGGAHIFNWGGGGDILFRIEQNAENSFYSLETCHTPYSTHQQADTIFKIDIADDFKAGIARFTTQYESTAKLGDLPIEELLAVELSYEDIYGDEVRLSLPVVSASLEYMKEQSRDHGAAGITDSSRVVGFMQQGDTLAFGGCLPGFDKITGFRLRYGRGKALASAGFKHTLPENLAKSGEIYELEEHYPNLEILNFSNTEMYNLRDEMLKSGYLQALPVVLNNDAVSNKDRAARESLHKDLADRYKKLHGLTSAELSDRVALSGLDEFTFLLHEMCIQTEKFWIDRQKLFANFATMIGSYADKAEYEERTVKTEEYTVPVREAPFRVDVVFTASAAKEAGISSKDQAKIISFGMDALYEEIAADDDLSIGSITVYSDGCDVDFWVEGGSIRSSVTGLPDFYYTASSTSGLKLSYDKDRYDMSKALADENANNIVLNYYQPNTPLFPKVPSNQYMLILTTDSAEIAGTEDDLLCQLSYKTLDGFNKQTEIINIRESMDSYFGYWPGETNHVAYQAGTCRGGKLYALVQIKDLDYFTGISVRLGDGGTDEWQGSEVELYQLDNANPFGERKSTWETVTDTDGNVLSDRRFTRDFNGRDISPEEFENGAKIFVQGVEAVEASFETTSLVEKGDDVDWSALRYSMTVDEAKQGLGFTKARANYTVFVQVAGDVVTDADNGDCGSKNQFYFQLLFEQGKSGYVLANQQLSSDGFRSGQMESFRVTMNQDYGRLTGVNIIPENPNDPDTVFDKLKISYIEVRKDSTEELVPTWKLDINSWISVDYTDIGAQNTVSGQTGRTEGEMTRSFLVTSSGYSVNLLFALTTGDYVDDPFEGALRATIQYYDVQGKLRTMDIDVVEAMYSYANIEPHRDTLEKNTEATSEETFTEKQREEQLEAESQENAALMKSGWVGNRAYAQVDRSFMLRPNHTDRFVVAINDLQKITSVTLHVASVGVAGQWQIKRLDIYRITSKGVLNINSENEYQNTAKTELFCSSSVENYSIFYTANDTRQSKQIEMGDNLLEVDVDRGWITALDYEPQSKDDQINLFVYMSEDEVFGYHGDYNLKIRSALQYSVSKATVTNENGETVEVSDGSFQTSATLQFDKERKVFYAKGLRTSGMVGISKLSLQLDSMDIIYAPVSHAIIEQIRSGVVIDTYDVDFGSTDIGLNGASVTNELGNRIASRKTANQTEKQTVSLIFGENTEKLPLHAKVNDFVLSISYISKNDSSRTEVTSPNIFLSDQGVKEVRGGQVIQVDFNQAYVDEITGVTVTAIGTLNGKVDVDMAAVGTYELGVNGWENTAWYGFENSVQNVGLSPRRLLKTASSVENAAKGTPDETNGSVSPVTLTFKTAETANGGGTIAPIRARLVYNTSNGAVRERNYTNLRQYLSAGSFENPGEATVKLMVPNMKELRYIEVEPYDDSKPYDNESWAISAVSANYIVNGREYTSSHICDDMAVEGAGLKINLSDIVLYVGVSTFNETSGELFKQEYRSTVVTTGDGILLEPGQTVAFSSLLSDLSNGNGAIVYLCERVADSAAAMANVCLEEQDGTVIFTPLENSSGTPYHYRVTIYSEEIPSICVKVNLTVESGTAKSATPETDEISAPEGGGEVLPPETGEETTAPEGGGEVAPSDEAA